MSDRDGTGRQNGTGPGATPPGSARRRPSRRGSRRLRTDGGDDREYPEPDGAVPSVDPADLHRRIRAGERVTLLDLRDRDEFESWRIEGETVETTQVPYVKFVGAQVRGGVEDLVEGMAEPILAVCPRGEASAYVADLLREEGIDARNLAGGMDAWARLLVAEELDAGADGATVLQYDRPSSGCLGYLVVAGEEAAVVDPLRAFADRYAEDAREHGAELRYVLDTHVHADHLSGLRRVADATGATAVVPAGAEARGLTYLDRVETVADGDRLPLGGSSLEAVALPGHTTEMTGFRVGEVLLAGDSLFVESVARPDLEAGDEGAADLAGQLYDTIHERILAMDDDAVVAPGHHGPGAEPAPDGTYTATVGELRERLRAPSMDRASFVEYLTGDLPPRPANFEAIIDANLGRASPDDETAFELELGPNNCAATPTGAD